MKKEDIGKLYKEENSMYGISYEIYNQYGNSGYLIFGLLVFVVAVCVLALIVHESCDKGGGIWRD